MTMDREEWLRVKAVVAECLDVDPAERASHLAQLCNGDHALIQEAASILASHAEAGDFLEQPAIGPPEAGMRLGPWLLEAEVGSGGMGRIYLASRADGVYSQKAAVKVLRRGMDTDTILSHFQSERQILASLNHPNIARLLDGGATQDGRPFFVMEFIDGRPLDRWIAERNPDTSQRLRLFQQVCGAVQYAHQRLVVHRDIKPANILVTGDGSPKLVDFGIAKLIGQGPALTAVGERMLTPAYASPEQLAGEEVTTASDVYSLGVVLRELLAGVTAKGDLENIVAKAVEPEAARRYGSAAQLAEDIQRYLDGMPVEARSQTLMYRTARFVRRNRLLAATAALLIVVLAVGLAATLWQYRIATHERRQAQERFNKLRKLANSVIHEFHDSIADLPGATAARALMLTRALEYLDGLAAEAGDDAALRLELAEAYQRVGDVQGGWGRASLGKWGDAQKSYAKAVTLLEGLPGSEPALARVLLRIGGEPSARRAVDLASAAGKKSILADAYYSLANEIAERGDFAGALAIREKDLLLRREILAADPKSRSARSNLALVAKRIGGLLTRLNRMEDAYERYAEALAIERQWLAADPQSLEARTAVSFSTSDIGFIRLQQKRLPEALTHYRETVALREALYAADSSNFRTRSSLASGLWRTADVLVALGRPAESLPLLQRAESLLRGEEVTPTHREALANIRYVHGLALGRSGKPLIERARAEFAQLSRESPGRGDLTERLAEIDASLK